MNILYCRKSSEDNKRQVLSIESQETELLALAKMDGVKIDKIFRESMSAKSPGRPEFEKMVKLIEKHNGISLYVWKLDRLARNPMDEGKIKWLLQNEVIVKIVTPERTYYPDDNALISAVEFGMARQYIADLSKNVKRGNRAKLQRGELPGRAPFGYLNDKANHAILIDPDRSHWVKFMFEQYATGAYSLKDLTNLLHEKGLRTTGGYKFGKAMVHHLLTNPFYYGIIRRCGQDYSGSHKSLVTSEIFDQVQEILSGKNRPRKQKHFHPLRGYLKCASCGCALTVTTKKGHVYWYCTNGKGQCAQHLRYLRQNEADLLVAKEFKKLQFDTQAIKLAYQAAKAKTLAQGQNQNSQKDNLAKQLKIAQDKLSNLADVIATDPSLKDSLKAKILSLEADTKTIQRQLNDIQEQTLDEALFTLEQTKKTFLQASNASFDYLNAGNEKKFELLKILLWNLKIENQTVQCFQLKQPFQLMAESPKNLEISQWLG